MGEKIKILAYGKIINTEYEIELNHPSSKGQDKTVHIQSKKFRLELENRDYLKLAFSILIAVKNLKIIKGMND